MIYYFPIDKVTRGEIIVLYGLGLNGRNFVKWNNRYQYCKIECIIDKERHGDRYFNLPIVDIEEFARNIEKNIENCSKIKIVITSKNYENEMIADLHKYGIEDEKIVLIGEALVEDDEYADNLVSASVLGKNDYWGESGLEWYKKAENHVEETLDIFKPIFERYQLYDKCKEWLDFGCGEGRIINLLKDKIKKIYGCDINEKPNPPAMLGRIG